MTVTSREGLDIAILIYYTPVLVLSIGLMIRLGFKRSDGWLMLVTLSLLRLIGGSTGIAATYYPTNASLVACSLVTFGIGLSPLLLVLTAILRRVAQNMSFSMGSPMLNSHVWRIISLPVIVGLILGAISGSDVFSSDASTRHTGYELQEASALLYLAVLIGLSAITFLCASRVSHVQAGVGERRLLLAAAVSLPFLLVRVIYAVICAFEKGQSQIFSTYAIDTKAVVTQAVMSVAMEFIVVAIYIVAGYHVQRVAEGKSLRQGAEQMDSEQFGKQEMGTAGQ